MDVVYAKESRIVPLTHGGNARVLKGTHWPAGDPLVLAHPDLFSSDERYGLFYTVEPDGYGAPVETATAAPGEKRNARRG